MRDGAAGMAYCRDWLPGGKSAAVCFSIDDVHPGTSADAYEAGGDLAAGSLGRMLELQRRHAELKLTLCVTPDWRLKSLVPDTRWLRRVPWLKDRVHWTRLHPRGHFRIDRYPALVSFLNGLERCEVALHGLTHTHPGPKFAVEFQQQSVDECAARVARGLEIFDTARIGFVRGFVPPAWNAPPSLIAALDRLGFQFLCSARDLQTKIARDALTSMSGLGGVSLLYPQFVSERRVVHLSCNFQATSSFERAFEILDHGGVLHIKAHIFKAGGGHVMMDGLDDRYCQYLDRLFVELKRRFGHSLWWAHLSEVAQRARLAA
jgi:hypothetical protein